MSLEHDSSVSLRPWAEGDLPLLEKLLGDPKMTEHLGGPETPEQLAKRHQRYLDLNSSDGGQMFVIVAAPENQPAGSVGYWDREGEGEPAYETGWSVLPTFQGRGIATQAIKAVLAVIKAEGKRHFVHAYPSTLNDPSNAVCRKTGFTLVEELEFEYPKGHLMRCNDWRIDLREDEE